MFFGMGLILVYRGAQSLQAKLKIFALRFPHTKKCAPILKGSFERTCNLAAKHPRLHFLYFNGPLSCKTEIKFFR